MILIQLIQVLECDSIFNVVDIGHTELTGKISVDGSAAFENINDDVLYNKVYANFHVNKVRTQIVYNPIKDDHAKIIFNIDVR